MSRSYPTPSLMMFSILNIKLINLQLLPQMQLIRTKLTTLLELINNKHKDITIQSQSYPNSHTYALDAYTAIKKQINQIIQCIAYTISNSNSNQQFNYTTITNLKIFCTKEEMSKMAKIKANLEEVRNYFLQVPRQSKVNLNQIKADIKNIISFCDHSSKYQSYEQKNGQTTFPSKANYDQFITNFPVKKNNFSFSESQQQKTARIKGHLYKQMNDYISMPKNSPKVEFQKTVTEQKGFGNNIYARLQYDEKEKIEKNKKKRFNYLQQCEKQINRIKQHNTQQINNNLKQSLTTPINTKKSQQLPSTQANFPQFNQQKYPFGVQISRIPPSKYREQGEEVIEIGLKQFLQDSLENQQHGQDSDDSLQLMKKQQNLNQTGCFAMANTQQKQQNQFSFCLHNK